MNFHKMCLLAVAALFGGCKLVIQVPEGGSIVSKSGAYECHAGQKCEIGVYDVFFDETFTAQAKPGYEFLKWRKGPSRLCGDQTEPCQLTTTGFPGHPNLLAFLETDTPFYLEPVFRGISHSQFEIEYRDIGQPAVRDVHGVKIGSLERNDTLAIDIAVHFKGLPDAYRLRIIPFIYFPRGEGDTAFNLLFAEAGNCEKTVNPMARANEDGTRPTKIYTNAENRIYIPIPNAPSTHEVTNQRYDGNQFSCVNWREQSRLYPLAATNYKLAFPLTVDGMDGEIDPNPELME